ncbi:enoyl-CoA hydratase/isomerase family protein [Amycolatopsis pithecellobii]|uniref:enoyl-CoA hydratase/isomerase family protein n=1 Tax=Amycolatopsis pithecellobii TaxID=664692 RepID=UPI001407F081|nr:enoyl-CoA hydratase/isomerase family protein [Amycolatopsis pithecellobii]
MRQHVHEKKRDMMSSCVERPEYADDFNFVYLSRQAGVLEVRLHTGNGDVRWNLEFQAELVSLWERVARDEDNRVVIVTGTGDTFIHLGGVVAEGENRFTPRRWKTIHGIARRLVLGHLDIEVPMIAAVNGPATIHCEQALLCDIVIAADTAFFADRVHFTRGIVPGDGIHTVLSTVFGLNRARYMALTGKQYSAEEALRMGVVNEVLDKPDLLPRAHQIARELVAKPDVALRSTRMVLTRELRRSMSDAIDVGVMAEGVGAMEYWPGGDRE